MFTGPSATRLALCLIGALAGLAFWWLSDGLRQGWLPERSMLGLTAAAFAVFTVLMGLTGPLRPLRAGLAAAGVGLVLGGALWWAAGRHAEVEPFLERGYPLMAYGMALLIATPFLGAGLAAPGGWRDYPALFALGWQVFVRFMAAAIFTGLFWGLVSLSDALLRIVGLELIALLTRQEVAIWMLTGAVFGFAVAVVEELRDFLSPYLLLRLLRLFLPLVLVVSALFVTLLPLRGWEGLMTGLSPAATLIAFAVAAIVLVTVAVERDATEAVQTPVMRAAVQLMALLVPVLAGLAIAAVWMRVGQYGWTPPRLIAATLAGVALAYGLGYAGAVLRRGGWMARIRGANIALALGCLAVCLLWLTPALVPERIAAASQEARARAGLPAAELPLDALARDWGHPGRDALARIEAGRPDLAEPIAAARDPLAGALPADPDRARLLLATVPVYPGTEALPEGAFAGFEAGFLDNVARNCANALPEGPGCALYVGRFDPEADALQALLFQRWAPDSVAVQPMALRDGRLVFDGGLGMFGGPGPLPDAALSALHRGAFALEPSTRRVLRLEGFEIFPSN